ncbi:dihydropteroate synthase [Granulicoccus sp. GXG6511]|uniref:dihydropteroate synthase n=1 Tax=Granulicoccus sp. GXG6511 TaxID=3381351 RepID=UPI003D7CCEFB
MILDPGPTKVMGIINVTPDSFSDGGDWFDHDLAISHGRDLLAQGAHLIDIGGESTRPGIIRTDSAEELRRILPVVEALAAEGAILSIDTMRAEVAVACVQAGAALINDVSGGLADPAMLPAVAELGVPFVAMHWRAHSTQMQDLAHYENVVIDVRDELAARAEAALVAGIAPERLILDPGIGFAKTGAHNWALLEHLDVLAELGFPLLLGVSRKRFLGDLLAAEGRPRPPKERDDASAAITTILALQGIWAVRTHSVRQHLDAIAVATRLSGR